MNRVHPISMGRLWAELAKGSVSGDPTAGVASSLAIARESELRLAVAKQYEKALGVINGREIPWPEFHHLMIDGCSTYATQLELLAGIQVEGKPLFERDWLVGAIGIDAPLLHTVLKQRGEVTATSLNPSELVTLAKIAEQFELDLNPLLGDIDDIRTIPRRLPLDESFRPENRHKNRAFQVYGLRMPGRESFEMYHDIDTATFFRWAGGFAFIPIDLKDIETLKHYLAHFRKGRRFGGLMLKGNVEIFWQSLFSQQTRYGYTPPDETREVPENQETVRKHYEVWLENTLKELFDESVLVVVNGTDIPYALPFLLEHGYQILAPNAQYGCPITPCTGYHRITPPTATSRLGNIEIAGGTEYRDGFQNCIYTIALDLDGSFIVLKGPAGSRLRRIRHQLSDTERQLVEKFVLLSRQSHLFRNALARHFLKE